MVTWKILLQKELRYFMADFSSWLFSIAFYLLSITMYKFIASGLFTTAKQHNVSTELDLLFLLLFFIFAHILFFSFGNDEDYKHNIYEQFYLKKGDLLEILTVKYVASIITSLLFLSATFPFIFLLMNFSFTQLASITASITILIPLINLFVLFSSILLLGESRKQYVALVILPLAMPVLILAILAITSYSMLLVMFAVLLINLPIMLFVSSRIVADFIRFK